MGLVINSLWTKKDHFGIVGILCYPTMKSSVIVLFGLISMLYICSSFGRRPAHCPACPACPGIRIPVVKPPTNPRPPTKPLPPNQPQGGKCGNACKCTQNTFEGPLGLPIGKCLTQDPLTKNFYCYVSANSGCPDKKPSTRQVGLFYSFKACDCDREEHILAADYAEYYDSNDSNEYEYDYKDESYPNYPNY